MSDTPAQPDSSLESPPEKGFAELWLKSQNTLGGYVCAHVPDHALAEDVMQEVARKATANFGQYDHSKPFLGWLIGIARQRIADAYRAKNRRPIVFSSDIVDSFAKVYEEIEPEEDDRAEGLRICMDKLSDRHRRVMDLKYGRRQSTKTIADQVGASVGSIDTMIYRIREALRQCINQYLERQR
ncbi:MAG: sigma-70 family RNA polymerase sigma factor [Phycisphaeraceae bacterium]|nr:sigma-70 family RNA polymerase sigma factor [Phycisphaeraceae bacterium]